jgi:hypothetical protein
MSISPQAGETAKPRRMCSVYRDRKLRTCVVPASFDRCLARADLCSLDGFPPGIALVAFWRHTCGVLMKAGVSSSDLFPALLRYLPWRQSVAQDISRHLIFVGRPPAMAWESSKPQSWVALRKCLWEIALPSVSRPQAGPRGYAATRKSSKATLSLQAVYFAVTDFGQMGRSFLTVARLHFTLSVDPVSPPS